MGTLLAETASLAVQTAISLGYVGLAVLLFMESLFPPIPSEVILPLAGYLVRQGHLSFVGVLLATTAGATAGLLVFYTAGRRLGEDRLGEFIARYGRILNLRKDDLERARDQFDERGGKLVLLSHVLPTVTVPVALIAGVARMPVGWFLAYTALGVALWNVVLVGLGWVLGAYWAVVQEWMEVLGYVALAAVIAVALWLFWHRRGGHRRSQPAQP
jgi:membrane protein DedA with SNARE-associated domain